MKSSISCYGGSCEQQRRGYSDVASQPQRQAQYLHDRNNNNTKNSSSNTASDDYVYQDERSGTTIIPTRGQGGGGERHPREEAQYHSRTETNNNRDNSSNNNNNNNNKGGRGYQDSEDWKCLECAVWNYPDEGRCHRCGAYAEGVRMNPNHQETRNDYYHQHDHHHRRNETADQYDRCRRRSSKNKSVKEEEKDEEVDEFGRKPAKRAKQPSEWPPCFDTHGADYVLDARSGMFYHATSQFFYDPQTTLYYGNRQATYYRYDHAQQKQGKKFQIVETTAQQQQRQQDPILLGAPSTNSKTNKKTTNTTNGISIKLKTKKLPGSEKPKPTPPTVPTTATPPPQQDPLQRRHIADIHKWSERQEELKQHHQTGTNHDEITKQDDDGIARTAKGEPMCRLCQRKFPTVEKLHYHIRVSLLHKENVQKQRNNNNKAATHVEEPRSTTYIDRAQQRRVLYGDDTHNNHTAVVVSTATTTAHTQQEGSVVDSVVVRPEDTLGTHHVGNQMLQKLGWKEGTSIGRRQQQDLEQQQSSKTGGGAGEHPMKRDWERIEALAVAQQQQTRPQLN